MSERFLSQLDPELRKRLEYVLQDLRDRGWDPVVPEVYGTEGTGYRSYEDQLELRRLHPGRTSVSFSFHNVTEPLFVRPMGNVGADIGTRFRLKSPTLSVSGLRSGPRLGNFKLKSPLAVPRAMAVHVIDRKAGSNAPKGHPFWQDLETAAERHGLRTGNSWKKPWDPAHVQLYENRSLRDVRVGKRPPLLKSKLVLWAPRLSLKSRGAYLPPRTLDNFMAGERFQLHMTDAHR